MNSESNNTASIRLYRTSPHTCSYLPDRLATTVFVDPSVKITKHLNSQLTDKGFRRSGAHIYRPDCQDCKACISCRIPVAKFNLKRRHKKILNRNLDVVAQEVSNLHCQEAFDLYCRYISKRHSDGDMYPATEEQYLSFIATKTESTRFFKFSLDNDLVAVSVLDELQHGLSAVYTFFDTGLSKRSLGNFVILWQLHRVTMLGLPYLYLGYWVKHCTKMQYKSEFRPLELLVNKRWVVLT
ncbi:MAG: arginyltransferase [Pseudohongiellaceae bacterium]